MSDQEFQTEEEQFWAGDFGVQYIQRNQPELCLPSNIAFFTRVLQRMPNIKTVIELGANIGNNMMALHTLKPSLKLTAVEINKEAFTALNQLDYVNAIHSSILSLKTDQIWDLVLLKGVLIHQSPQMLPQINALVHRLTSSYVCIAEYYNPTPVEVPYRGHRNRLYKRDFAGDMLDQFIDLKLLDYGFQYRRDPMFPMDDMNWFILEKS